jgi:hypothetical protein
MVEVEIRVPPGVDWEHAEQSVEGLCAAEGLAAALKATLVRYPGSVHWHFKRAQEPGTLEITLWESAHRIWFSTRAGRAAPWIDDAMSRLRGELDGQLEHVKT